MTGPLVDEQAALWAARLVLPRVRHDASVAAALRADVAADLPEVDRAARAWSRLGDDLPPTEVRVIGRVGWVRANLHAVRGVLDPIADRIRRRSTQRVLGVQLGAMLGLLSTKVLGQYILPLSGPGAGQLVVVGPNLVELAEEHGDLAGDIRRAVLVHEVTHRLQFDGAPWLGNHLRGLLDRYVSGTTLDTHAVRAVAADLPGAVQQVLATGSVTPLLEVVLTPEQQEVVAEAQGLMSLLEGHGNAAMYLGSGAVVKDPEAIRDALARRKGDAATKILTAVAGLDMKRRQYAEGEAFVRHVVDRRGVEGLNLAFAEADNLPAGDEINEPDTWMARVGA